MGKLWSIHLLLMGRRGFAWETSQELFPEGWGTT